MVRGTGWTLATHPGWLLVHVHQHSPRPVRTLALVLQDLYLVPVSVARLKIEAEPDHVASRSLRRPRLPGAKLICIRAVAFRPGRNARRRCRRSRALFGTASEVLPTSDRRGHRILRLR